MSSLTKPEPSTITGGKFDTDLGNTRKLLLSSDIKLFIDGHNLGYNWYGDHFSKADYVKMCIDFGKRLCKEIPSQEKHVVLKNSIDEQHGMGKKEYIKAFTTISKKCPEIHWHLAYGSDQGKVVMVARNGKRHEGYGVKYETDESSHYMKGRDDFLSIYLSQDSYLLAHDKYKDYKYFAGIAEFDHYYFYRGTMTHETINPIAKIQYMRPPNIGNHFRFEFMSPAEMKKNNVKPGEVYVIKTPTDNRSVIYFTI